MNIEINTKRAGKTSILYTKLAELLNQDKTVLLYVNKYPQSYTERLKMEFNLDVEAWPNYKNEVLVGYQIKKTPIPPISTELLTPIKEIIRILDIETDNLYGYLKIPVELVGKGLQIEEENEYQQLWAKMRRKNEKRGYS